MNSLLLYCIVHIIKSYHQNTKSKCEINKPIQKNEIGAFITYARRDFIMFIGVVQPFIKRAKL